MSADETNEPVPTATRPILREALPIPGLGVKPEFTPPTELLAVARARVAR